MEDSVNACRAGASRIELNSALEAGGLSPSQGLLEEVRDAVDVPLMVMARPVSGGFAYSNPVKKAILRDMYLFLQKGADGLVFGALTEDGTLDMPFIRQIRKEFSDTVLVFSRAFDCLTGSLTEHASILAENGIDRILTSGGKPTAEEGLKVIRDLTGRGIDILPGSGISSLNIWRVAEETKCRWVHGSFKGVSAPVAAGHIIPPSFPSVDEHEIRKALLLTEGM